jgi:hypothetical protein
MLSCARGGIERSAERQIAVMLCPGIDIEIRADSDDAGDVVEPLGDQHREHSTAAVADEHYFPRVRPLRCGSHRRCHARHDLV